MASVVIPATSLARSAHRQAILRFACGVSAAFLLSEIMGWHPTFLAPLLAATLLSSRPTALPLGAGLLLIVIQAAGAYSALALTLTLSETPTILFGVVGLVLLLSFSSIAAGRNFFPILLLLICFSTIPVVGLAAPSQAAALPPAFVRAMIVAVTTVWLAHAIWPLAIAKPSAAAAPLRSHPTYLALAGSAIVLPLMLVYLMYGITDALPVLITTVVLVVNFDPQRGAVLGFAMILGNLLGGAIAAVGHALLGLSPSLFTLSCLTFVLCLIVAQRVERGGAAGSIALITGNQAIVMLSLGLPPGSTSVGLWASRLLQFAIAYAFAVGLMYLLLPRGRK